jgi:4-hydroxybenzoate polyprenyltransferase
MKEKLKAYMDLTRLHFFFVWPTLFCSGLFLAFQHYGGFSLPIVVTGVLIGFFGFEAGLVLNDIVDADIDKKDVEFDKLTKYWRPFGKRPISQGLISRREALLVFGLLVIFTVVLTLTLPVPHSLYVVSIMAVCYCLEVFYQIVKRKENFPLAQLIGRIDFTLFPVAGYLAVGSPDINALLFALFFYPLAMAHLGVNDIIDVANDQARGLKTIPTLYGMAGTSYWILAFSAIHFVTASVFLTVLGLVALPGFAVSLSLIAVGNYLVLKSKTAVSGIKALPLFHVAMLIYAVSIIVVYFVFSTLAV